MSLLVTDFDEHIADLGSAHAELRDGDIGVSYKSFVKRIHDYAVRRAQWE